MKDLGEPPLELKQSPPYIFLVGSLPMVADRTQPASHKDHCQLTLNRSFYLLGLILYADQRLACPALDAPLQRVGLVQLIALCGLEADF
uniref:hypothetical protein n=1 Tax=Agrobacterium radiobacter TaxID=362 RepID=UPI00155DC989|nr:hypothetical protein [Agrobacterium radiobacter]